MARKINIYVNQRRREEERRRCGFQAPGSSDFPLDTVIKAEETFRRDMTDDYWRREVSVTVVETAGLMEALSRGQAISWNGMRWRAVGMGRSISDRGHTLTSFSMEASGPEKWPPDYKSAGLG